MIKKSNRQDIHTMKDWPTEVDTYYPHTIEIAADIEYTVDAILNELENERQRDTIKKNPDIEGLACKKSIPHLFKKIKKEVTWRIDRFSKDTKYPIKPEKLIVDVRNVLSENDIVISDVGAHKLWIAKVYNTYAPNACLITNGFYSMGFALPGAIAAQLANLGQKVVAMCGDGGFLMNVQELETAVRLKLPIIVVVWCDCDFGMISLKQSTEFGRTAFTKFTFPDFVKLAESFGAKGYKIDNTQEFQIILEKARDSVCVPVMISEDMLNGTNYTPSGFD